ncbi:MAG: GMC family oxidoreductase [Desulfobacterales bacterium]|nr:GMC family oxidoreductase [Desulfobacterales bacterium]
MTETADLVQRKWDVIIVGTGMGGATLGYALAKAGKSVLFCEKGRSHLSDMRALCGDYAETFFARPEVPQPKHCEILGRAGRCWEEVEDLSTARSRRFIPFIGSGTGGSSAIYGMAMERFFSADFTPRRHYQDTTESTLPDCWPITYEELQPYYEEAERLYRVRGTPDPLRGNETSELLPPPSPCPGSRELEDFLRAKGLHPYRLPSACEYVSGCQGCQGFLCGHDCRNDSARICLEPALTQFSAHLLDDCEVLKLEATQSAVRGVVCSWHRHELTLRAKIVVLAAGALATPRILLDSASPAWPYGLANDSGLVGKNLMRHYIDLYAVFPKIREGLPGNLKEIAFNDFYIDGGQKFGTVQSFGAMPPGPVIVESMEQELRDSPLPSAAWLFKLAKPVVKSILGHLFSRSIILAAIMEDLPIKDNRVMLSEQPDSHGRSRLIIKYRSRESDSARIKAFREKLRAILKPYRFMLIKQAENNERLAHVCGTCRFGLDPNESVLDANNKAHGLSNLYVVDSSFFPSSGGTNPGLTIAANALRVSEKMLKAS